MAVHHIAAPAGVTAAGDPPKRIDEYAGRVRTGDDRVSVARMHSPAGWSEPAQTPRFDEWTVVLAGSLRVEHGGGTLEVGAGEAVWVTAGERVRYSTPGGAEYLAVCLPAFSPELAHREDEAP